MTSVYTLFMQIYCIFEWIINGLHYAFIVIALLAGIIVYNCFLSES